MHETILCENASFGKFLEPQHDSCSPTLEYQWKTNENDKKTQSMFIIHTLTKAKVRFIQLHKLLWTSTASNICIKPLRLPMELKHVQNQENVCKSKTLHISSLAAARTCFMMIRGIERRPTKTHTFHNPYFNQGQATFHRCEATVWKPKTLHISSLAATRTCFMMLRGIERRLNTKQHFS